jgi:hypothetical protein
LEEEDGSDLGDILLLLAVGLGIVLVLLLMVWLFGIVGEMFCGTD